MSARQRTEVLRQFSKPLVDLDQVLSSTSSPSKRRTRRSNARIVMDCSESENESDFLPDAQSDGDDSFMDDDGDNSPWTSKGKGKGKAQARPEENPVVMLISLKAGALGLNLTVANNVT